MKLLSIIAYCLILIQGSMILVPFGILLILGLFEGMPAMRILIAIADIAIVGLVIISLREKTKSTFLFEIACFFALLAPLVAILIRFPIERFNYFGFLFPFSCFAILFPLSILLDIRKINHLREISDKGSQ